MKLEDFEEWMDDTREKIRKGDKIYICHAMFLDHNFIEAENDFYKLMMPKNWDEDICYGFFGDPKVIENQMLRVDKITEFEQLVIEDDLYEHY